MQPLKLAAFLFSPTLESLLGMIITPPNLRALNTSNSTRKIWRRKEGEGYHRRYVKNIFNALLAFIKGKKNGKVFTNDQHLQSKKCAFKAT